MKILEILKKIRNALTDITNFILLLPVYFLGVGLSHLIWKLFYRENVEKGTFWTKSKPLPKRAKECSEMY